MKRNYVFTFLILSNNFLAQNVIMSDSISLTINEQNTIFVKAVFIETDTLNLNFDKGTTELILTNEVLKNRLKSSPKLYKTFCNLKIGNTAYKTKVYDAELTRNETDGRFGWDFFKGKIVELNTGRKQLYGTQFDYNENGVYPKKLKNKKNVNRRRIALGLDSIEVAIALMTKIHLEQNQKK